LLPDLSIRQEQAEGRLEAKIRAAFAGMTEKRGGFYEFDRRGKTRADMLED